MTDRCPSEPVPGRRHRSLYRTVLSLAVAAIVAAWLPFSVLYVSALNKPATPVAAIVQHAPGSATRVVTTASGATRVLPANSASASTAAPVLSAATTRAS